MAAVKIRARGAKPAAKQEDEAPKKPARRTRSTGTKRGASKSTPAKAPAARRGPGRPRKEEGAPTRRNSTGVDARVEAKLLKAVEKAGDRRRKAEEEHKESVNHLHTVAKEALDAGVSMAKVSDSSGISRQWLYKMGEFAGRGSNGGGNGKAEAPKATTRSTSRKRSAPAASKRSNGKGATKQASGGSRRRVAIRSAA